MKTCKRCNQTTDNFGTNARSKDGLSEYCRPCRREQSADWYHKNGGKEKHATYHKENAYARKALALSVHAKREGRESTVTGEDVANVLQAQGYRCAICKDMLGDFYLSHIVAPTQGGKSEADNMQCLCKPCNKGKYMLSNEEFIEHCRKVTAANE